MPQSQTLQDWQEAERLAEAAALRFWARRDAGELPTDAQVDELDRLRNEAAEKMRIMVEDARNV